MAIRWISNSRRATQRLGFCKAILTTAGTARSVAEMADDVRGIVFRSVAIDPAPATLAWIAAQRGTIEARQEGGRLIVEQQIAYLARHSARSGWLSPKGVDEYVEVLPRRLGLVDEVFRVAEAGQLMARTLLSPRERGAWGEYDAEVNPLALSREQSFFLLYLLLLADGDFLIPWSVALCRRFGRAEFGYLAAGAEIPNVLHSIGSTFESVAYLDADRRQLASLDSTRARIAGEIESQEHLRGGGSRREQIAVPRLEWLVDLGVLARVDPDVYTYRFTPEGLETANNLAFAYDSELRHRFADTALDAALDNCYIAAASPLLGDTLARELVDASGPHEVDIVDYLLPPYRDVSSVTGYLLLKPLVVLAAIYARREHRPVQVEYVRAVEMLEMAYKANPERLHYTIDRLSTDYQVRFLPL